MIEAIDRVGRWVSVLLLVGGIIYLTAIGKISGDAAGTLFTAVLTAVAIPAGAAIAETVRKNGGK